MTPRTNRHVLIALLLATLLAAYFAPPEETAGIPAATTHQPATLQSGTRQSAALPGTRVQALKPRDDGDNDPISALIPKASPTIPRTTAPPPVASVAAPITPAPKDEPPIIRVLGRYGGSGTQAALLQYGQETIIVKVGDTLADTWRVDTILADVITLVNRDTHRRHTLSFENK